MLMIFISSHAQLVIGESKYGVWEDWDRSSLSEMKMRGDIKKANVSTIYIKDEVHDVEYHIKINGLTEEDNGWYRATSFEFHATKLTNYGGYSYKQKFGYRPRTIKVRFQKRTWSKGRNLTVNLFWNDYAFGYSW